MEIVRKHNEGRLSVSDNDTHWKTTALQLEKQGDNKAAINIYENELKKRPLEPYVYNRLMICYRKEKQYKKELALATTAIEKFKALLQPVKNTHSKKIASLSRSILISTGLTNKKGAPMYYPQPIAGWEKRKLTIKRKLLSKKTNG